MKRTYLEHKDGTLKVISVRSDFDTPNIDGFTEITEAEFQKKEAKQLELGEVPGPKGKGLVFNKKKVEK